MTKRTGCVPSKRVFRKMKAAKNPVTRWSLRQTLINRIERGEYV